MAIDGMFLNQPTHIPIAPLSMFGRSVPMCLLKQNGPPKAHFEIWELADFNLRRPLVHPFFEVGFTSALGAPALQHWQDARLKRSNLVVKCLGEILDFSGILGS